MTKQAYEKKGVLFDVQPLKKRPGDEKDSALLPLKKGLPVSRYGGYNKATATYFMLVEHTERKRVRTLVPIDLHMEETLRGNLEFRTAYCRTSLGMENPRIILPQIKFNDLFEINGHRVYLAAKSGNSVVLCNAMELILPADMEAYAKKVFKFVERAKAYTRANKDETFLVTEQDEIDTNSNIGLYDLLLEKMHGPLKAFYDGVCQKLCDARSKFVQLPLEKQPFVLVEMISMLRVASRSNGDLRLIGLSANTGQLSKSRNIAPSDAWRLIRQSVTGLFENSVDLWQEGIKP